MIRPLAATLVAHGRVAQLVEQGIENPRVGGSIPSPATTPEDDAANPASRGVFAFRSFDDPRYRAARRRGVWSPPSPEETRMDIHDIALRLFAELVSANRVDLVSEAARIELGREAYRYAEAFIAAKDIYIRELPVANVEAGY